MANSLSPKSAGRMSPPSPQLRLELPPSPVETKQNGIGHFHSISLRSPADQPVVLSFDGVNGSVVGVPTGESCGGKSPDEGNSQNQLISDSPTASSFSKWRSFARSTGHLLASRRFLLALVALLTLLALLLVISLVLVIISGGGQRQQPTEEDAAFLNKDSNWRDSCERNCSAKFDVPPLLLISMDGFRADYLVRKITPAVARIMQCGASAQYMMPSYPSKTFPNHYSIVTGLYPESHGIVDNHFYDEEMPDEKNFAKSSRNPAWYNGEPIWNTVTKNGKKSAIFFWPGSEVPIQGMLPTYRYSYNASLPFSKRVDQVIEWLRFDDTDRPSFLAMYFEQPDTAMHREGPDSDAVNSALIYVDAMINYLMQRLDNNGFLGCINLVILSDHGAQKLREDHFISLDQFVNAKDPQVGGVFGGTIGHINFRNSASQTFIENVLTPMTCQSGQAFRVYTRESMPKRYHYTKSGRIGEIVIDSVGGTRLFVDQHSLREHGPQEKGDHGYDNRMREMRAIFGAWGPSVKRGWEEKPFQNIELYNLFTTLMQLPVCAPNNGTQGRLNTLLKTPSAVESTPSLALAECEGVRLVKCGDGCHFELNYQKGSVSVPSQEAASDASQAAREESTTTVPVYNSQHCQYAEQLLLPTQLATQGQQCAIRLCNSTLVMNRRLRIANFVESQLSVPIPNIDHRANCTAHFVVPNAPTTTSTSTMGTTETTTTKGESEGEQMISAVKRSRSTDDGPEGDDDSQEDVHAQSDPTTETIEGTPWNRHDEMGIVREDSSTEASMNSTSAGQSSTQSLNSHQQECAQIGGGAALPKIGGDANQAWISLFPDNDYARYIMQGQFQVPAGFHTGPWKQVLSLVRQYVQHYKRLLMWAGPVFDHDHDGLADPLLTNSDAAGAKEQLPPPSHIFLILLRCSNNTWHPRGRRCERPELTKTLAFVLPLVEKDLNCLFPVEYIFRHTARIRDIELLTGNEWFLDRDVYPPEVSIWLRTQLNEQLWQLELKS